MAVDAGTVYSNMSTYSRFNLDEELSDIQVFVNEYRQNVNMQLAREQAKAPTLFKSFHENESATADDLEWLKDNQERFFKDSPNAFLKKEGFLSELGYITSIVYSPKGDFTVVGHSTGLIQMRHGHTGTVLATLRNIQFPAKPVYCMRFSRTEERICYAACTDGAIYRIEIPKIDTSLQTGGDYCIRADPTLEWLNTQYYGSPGISVAATPFISQRSPALAFGMTTDSQKMIVGYGDTSIKIYDMATQEQEHIFKVHKLRLAFIPKKLQRVHSSQVCAVRCHDDRPFVFATAGWDRTLRVWDIRCKIGCMMTFEGVNVCHDSIDLNRDHCITGSWQASEALCLWDFVAKKRLSIIRVQNRRPDIDGEYIYSCRYWRSSLYNRKGKYGIIGGSGTGAVEVINLHNRYITCSYPAPGTVLAIASYNDRISFGGTYPVFNIVSFHDPKHEEYKPDSQPPYDYSAHPVTLFERDLGSSVSSIDFRKSGDVREATGESPHPISPTTPSAVTTTDSGDRERDIPLELEKDKPDKPVKAEKPERPDKKYPSTLIDVSKEPIKKSRISTLTPKGVGPPPKP